MAAEKSLGRSASENACSEQYHRKTLVRNNTHRKTLVRITSRWLPDLPPQRDCQEYF